MVRRARAAEVSDESESDLDALGDVPDPLPPPGNVANKFHRDHAEAVARRRKYPRGKLMKQLNCYVPLSDHCLVRDEAARGGITIVDLMKKWIEPHLVKLRGGR